MADADDRTQAGGVPGEGLNWLMPVAALTPVDSDYSLEDATGTADEREAATPAWTPLPWGQDEQFSSHSPQLGRRIWRIRVPARGYCVSGGGKDPPPGVSSPLPWDSVDSSW